MKNKSSTSAVALAKGAPRRASKLTLAIYKNHKKTSLNAGRENKKKEIIIVWVNKILLAVQNLAKMESRGGGGRCGVLEGLTGDIEQWIQFMRMFSLPHVLPLRKTLDIILSLPGVAVLQMTKTCKV